MPISPQTLNKCWTNEWMRFLTELRTSRTLAKEKHGLKMVKVGYLEMGSRNFLLYLIYSLLPVIFTAHTTLRYYWLYPLDKQLRLTTKNPPWQRTNTKSDKFLILNFIKRKSLYIEYKNSVSYFQVLSSVFWSFPVDSLYNWVLHTSWWEESEAPSLGPSFLRTRWERLGKKIKLFMKEWVFRERKREVSLALKYILHQQKGNVFDIPTFIFRSECITH